MSPRTSHHRCTCSGPLTHLSIFQKPTAITAALHKRLMFVYLTYLTSYWFPLIDLITYHTHYMHVPVRKHTALAKLSNRRFSTALVSFIDFGQILDLIKVDYVTSLLYTIWHGWTLSSTKTSRHPASSNADPS